MDDPDHPDGRPDGLPDPGLVPPMATPSPHAVPAIRLAAGPGAPTVSPAAVVPLARPPREAPTWELPPPAPLVVVREDDPECSMIEVSKAEITASAWQRPPHKRTPVPKPGDRVLFRMHEYGDFLDALVVSVQDLTRPGPAPDSMVWRRDNVTGMVAGLHADPWPEVTLDTWWGRLRTHECRVRGSAGWVPLDWDPPRADPVELARYR